jgi:hypothetical protein
MKLRGQHPELRCTLQSNTAPYCDMMHSSTLHPCEPSCTLLRFAASSWATVHPYELRCISLSYRRNQSGTSIKRSSPLPECYATRLRLFTSVSYKFQRWAKWRLSTFDLYTGVGWGGGHEVQGQVCEILAQASYESLPAPSCHTDSHTLDTYIWGGGGGGIL